MQCVRDLLQIPSTCLCEHLCLVCLGSTQMSTRILHFQEYTSLMTAQPCFTRGMSTSSYLPVMASMPIFLHSDLRENLENAACESGPSPVIVFFDEHRHMSINLVD